MRDFEWAKQHPATQRQLPMGKCIPMAIFGDDAAVHENSKVRRAI